MPLAAIESPGSDSGPEVIESPGSDSGPEVAAQNQTGAPLAAAAMMMREAGASKRKRGSCHFCRTHRIKCCRRRPCLNCLSRGFECVDAGGDVMVQVNGARRVVRQGDRDANGRARMRLNGGVIHISILPG